MEKTMQFKTKAQLAADKKSAETNGLMTVVSAVKDQFDPTPTPPPAQVVDAVPVQVDGAPPPAVSEEPALPVKGDDSFIQIIVPDYPKQLYDAATIENEMMDFQAQLGNAMRPVIVSYTPPPVPKAVAEATLREMDAGRKRVAEFAEQESQRRAIMAREQRRKEPWEGNNVTIFRPMDYVPNIKGTDRTGTLRVLNRE